MNTANLQLEGLLLGIAAINTALVEKGVLTRQELTEALRSAEAAIAADARPGLSAALRDGIIFPLRLLQLANNNRDGQGALSFEELARLVGQTKDRLDPGVTD